LWGWEPREFAEFHYNDAGLLIGTTTVREAEFTSDQVSLLLAHLRAKRDMGTHGQPMSEATSSDANPSVAGGWHYEANRVPRTDFAQLALERRMAAFYKKYEGKFSEEEKRAHQWYVRRVND